MRFSYSNLQPLFTIASYVLPVLILAIIWASPISHYYVPSVSITDHMIDAARHQPDDAVFDEIKRFFQSPVNKNNKQLIAEAEQILQRKDTIPGAPSSAIGFPFNADDLDKGLPGRQLFFARFSIPYLLLWAYEATARDDFLMAAKDIILGFASYERNAWLPKGLLWNDHAIAARISVMAKFWKLYRNHPDYQSEVARDLFELVARSAQLLAKPAHFTFATNHGIMQNLALWQICLAFPTLPNIEFYKQLALERMRDQMLFYVNDEGVVLEHSAGYQKAGLKFISMALRYLTLLDMSIPEDWKVKYQKAQEFYAQLQRSDGSLPMYGDTNSAKYNVLCLSKMLESNGQNELVELKKECIDRRPSSLYPVAGYSIWWDGLDEWPNKRPSNQTVVTWSYFPGHAHKHADEMSVLLWAYGQMWWTNIGYWPYGTKGRADAVSWTGSNAPHLADEGPHSKRNTKLLSYGSSDYLNVIDLNRTGPNEYVARRQVIYLNPNLWVVIDCTEGSEDTLTTTTWTTSPEVELHEGKIPGSYNLSVSNNSTLLATYIIGSMGTHIRTLRGSFEPFAGWVQRIPATSIVIEQPAKDSWAAAIWLLQESDREGHKFKGTPFMKDWKDPQNWRIELQLAYGLMSIWRKDDQVFVQQDIRGTRIRKGLQLSEPPQISNERAEINTAFENIAKKYPKKRYSMHRHLKASYLILFVFLLQELFFFVYKRIGWKYSKGLRGLSSLGWVILGVWVSFRI